jgi:glycosyltransferase involved in cell wall biosynthesis
LKTLQIGLGWFPERAGGLDRFYYDCARYLPQVGVDMQGLVAGSGRVAQESGGKVCAFAGHGDALWRRWRGVRRSLSLQLAQEDYSLIVSHFSLYTLPILDLIADKPLVVHFHGPWALEGDVEGQSSVGARVKLALEGLVYRRAGRLIVLSEAFGAVLRERYGVEGDRVHVIPGGVDAGRFEPGVSRAEARERLGWAGDTVPGALRDRRILVTVRRLAARMGLENLVEAIGLVRVKHPDVLLHIVGKGALAGGLAAKIEALGLGEHVKLLGFVPDKDLGLVYRAADLSVVPTVALEGFGLVILESLAAGTPVLGTPVGGIPEILSPFCEDLLLEGSGVEALARGIGEVLDGGRRVPDGGQCQGYVREHYDWLAIAQRIKSVYELSLE